MNLKNFISKQQGQCLITACKGEEKEGFQKMMVDLISKIEAMPKTYETDGQGEKATAHLHYFNGGSDWYITEKDQENEQQQAFGLACLNGDIENAEIGYISIQELIENNVELDLYWTPKTIEELTA